MIKEVHVNIYEVIIRKLDTPSDISKDEAMIYLQLAKDNDNYYRNAKRIYEKFKDDPEIRKELLENGFTDPKFLWSLSEDEIKNARKDYRFALEIVYNMTAKEIRDVIQRWKKEEEEIERKRKEEEKEEAKRIAEELEITKEDIISKPVEVIKRIRIMKNAYLKEAKEVFDKIKKVLLE